MDYSMESSTASETSFSTENLFMAETEGNGNPTKSKPKSAKKLFAEQVSEEQEQENMQNQFDFENEHFPSDKLPDMVGIEESGEEIFEKFQSPIKQKPSEAFVINDSFQADFSLDHETLNLRRPDLINFLAEVTSLLDQRLEWCQLAEQIESKITFVEWDWTKYRKQVRYDQSKHKIDMIAVKLYDAQGDMELMPVYVSPNGDCLYNAKSVLLCGDESLALELRVSATIAMTRKRPGIMYEARQKGIQQIIGINYEEELENCATEGSFQSSLNCIALCWATKSSLVLLYPNNGVGLTNYNALVNSGIMGAAEFEASGHNIMWSGPMAGNFNHFVPMLQCDNR